MTATNGQITKAFHRKSNDQNTYHFLDEKMTILVSGEDTNGAYAVANVIKPAKQGPPLHVHENEDETFYIKRGTLTFFVGEEVIEAKAGDYVFAPRGIEHRFVTGDEEAEFIITASPAGFDTFVKDLGTSVPENSPLPQVGPPTEEKIIHLVNVSKKYGITYPEIEKAMLNK
jgi:quercetin dioxygenase-like cupin family protein